MSITRDHLEDLVKQGLVADIFKMEQSHASLKTIGTKAAVINAAGAGNFGELFGSLQTALQTEAILAAARLCDPPNKKYPTRCIRGLLDYLETHSNKLPPIKDIENLNYELRRIGMDRQAISLAATDEPTFALALVGHFRAIFRHPRTVHTIDKLKNIRDKAIAHNEQVTQVRGPTWGGLEQLIAHAKDLAGVLGWAYLNTVYMHKGEYVLTPDAERPSMAMNRLLKRIIPHVT